LRTTAVWYDLAKTDADMLDWFAKKRTLDHPVLVARIGKQVVGYATYGPFRAFPGYRHTVEHSVYVDQAYHRQGVGRLLLTRLIDEASDAGLHVMVGGIEAGNEASLALHRLLGFHEVGRLPEVGRKFDRWLTLVFVQLILDQKE
jgi:phosphinothricin acetyltransferase